MYSVLNRGRGGSPFILHMSSCKNNMDIAKVMVEPYTRCAEQQATVEDSETQQKPKGA